MDHTYFLKVPTHPRSCPLKLSKKNSFALVKCGVALDEPRKTGNKKGTGMGQWKAYCPCHGYINYDVEGE